MSIELKIKAKVLATEARMIRREELKLRDRMRRRPQERTEANEGQRVSLWGHRTGPVRESARATHIARAYLAGRGYLRTEQPSRNPVDEALMRDVRKMVQRYGSAEQRRADPDEVTMALAEWMAETLEPQPEVTIGELAEKHKDALQRLASA